MLYLPYEEGQGLVEYALVLLLIAVAVVAMVGLFGGQLAELYSQIVGCFAPEGSRPDICS